MYKKYYNFISKAIFGCSLFLHSMLVNANVPTADQIAANLVTDKGPIDFLKSIISDGANMGAVAISAFSILAAGVVVFSSFKEANEKDKWGKFGLVFGASVFVVTFVIVGAIFAIQYGTFT